MRSVTEPSESPPAGGPAAMLIDYVHHNPGEPPLESRFLDPGHLRRLGFTGQVCNHHVQAGVTMESFEPGLWEEHDEIRRWIESYAATMRKDIVAVKQAGLQCLAWTDFVVLPKLLVECHRAGIASTVVVPDEIGIKGVFTADIHQPLTREIIRAQVREVFATFPELDGLVVRVGETYLHDLPHHTGGDPITHGVASHVVLLELLREEICEKLDRTLVYRTWLSGIDEDADGYLEVCGRIAPHPKLVFAVKHCIGDFHRTHRFSPPLGIGPHRQVVEVQCQREYEGKGAFPNFIAAGVIDGFEEYGHLMPPDESRSLRDICDGGQFAGLITWSRGGGWMGPYIKDELWCDLNARVLARWSLSPATPTAELLDQVLAELGFAPAHRPAMRELLDLSARAVLRGVTGTRGDIDTLWTRDEFLGGYEPESPYMMRAVDAVREAGRIEATLAELDEALQLWQRIEELAAMVDHQDDRRLAFLRTSCTYGRIFQQVVRSGWTVILLGEQGARSGGFESDRITRAIDDYQNARAEWNELSRRPECPSLYRDTYCRYVTDQGMEPVPGMGASVRRYGKLSTASLSSHGPTDPAPA